MSHQTSTIGPTWVKLVTACTQSKALSGNGFEFANAVDDVTAVGRSSESGPTDCRQSAQSRSSRDQPDALVPEWIGSERDNSAFDGVVGDNI